MKKRAVLVAAMLAACPAALPHGDAAHGKKAPPKAAAQPIEEKAFGRAGDPKKVTRTVRIQGADDMRYTPAAITVKQGETIRFVVKNAGKILHETVLGTMAELQEHYELMKKFPDMEHDEPHMVHLKPGETGEMVWQFTKAGEFYFACLMPGHLEAGMLGKITVR
ncbi:MAG TPA: cupredoxin family protein [Burkholderiales bacterium]|nr:cupredoxin family protein [Burkholderiales bacterium]